MPSMKTVLITGASRGIGKALAQKFLQEGFLVFGTSTKGSLDYQHENLRALQLDLGSIESIESCVKKFAETGADLDILVNNAGVLLDEHEKALRPDLLQATLQINVIGTAAFTERMLSSVKKGSHIVMTSSTAGSLERTGHARARFPSRYPAYKISKAALNMYMRTLALRMQEEDITVSAVNPGWVKTDMGGEGADLTPEESAEDVYQFAVSSPPTGLFWFKGERLPW